MRPLIFSIIVIIVLVIGISASIIGNIRLAEQQNNKPELSVLCRDPNANLDRINAHKCLMITIDRINELEKEEKENE